MKRGKLYNEENREKRNPKWKEGRWSLYRKSGAALASKGKMV